MENIKSILSSLLISISIIISCIGAMYLWTNYKNNVGSSISATGSAEMDFESDLIVWRGYFRQRAETTEEAYNKIKSDADAVKTYLITNNITEAEMIFDSISINELTEGIYDENGNWRGSTKIGYELSQNVTITSKNIENVEKVSRDSTSLLENGVEFISTRPEYYCSTLSDMKLELIKKATANAKERIDIMAENANAQVGKLKNSKLGVFQIVAKNSGTSSYAYDGYLDTSSKSKTATITVKLEYGIK